MVIATAATPNKITFKMEPRNIPYIQYVVNLRTIEKTDNKAFLSKICLGEGKSFL